MGFLLSLKKVNTVRMTFHSISSLYISTNFYHSNHPFFHPIHILLHTLVLGVFFKISSALLISQFCIQITFPIFSAHTFLTLSLLILLLNSFCIQLTLIFLLTYLWLLDNKEGTGHVVKPEPFLLLLVSISYFRPYTINIGPS